MLGKRITIVKEIKYFISDIKRKAISVMLATQSSRKHGKNKDPGADSAVINHKRGDASDVTKRLKLLEGLQKKATEITC